MTQSSLGVSRCLTESPGEAVNEAVKSEGPKLYVTRTTQQSAANRSVLTMSLPAPDRCWPSPAMDYSRGICTPRPGDVIVRLNGWVEFSDWAAVNDLDEGHDCAAGRLRVDARHRGADRASHVD